jgi:Lon protease-like protein
MTEIGLFPLGVVLLPTEHVPLHIFEPRYRELIGECLDEDAEFGLIHVDDEELAEIGTRAAVVSVLERLPDGRLNIIVEGRERFRIVEETTGRSFRTALVTPVADDGPTGTDDAVARALGLYARLLELAGAEADTPDAADPQLSYVLAGRFELAAETKLELLALTSERVRLDRVCEILDAAARTIERQQQISALAQTNGKGH